MSEMVEYVARAILASVSDRSWGGLGLVGQASLLMQARAAIGAMREPSEDMKHAERFDLGVPLACIDCGGTQQPVEKETGRCWYCDQNAVMREIEAAYRDCGGDRDKFRKMTAHISFPTEDAADTQASD